MNSLAGLPNGNPGRCVFPSPYAFEFDRAKEFIVSFAKNKTVTKFSFYPVVFLVLTSVNRR